jgi:23S rRNA (adenine2503-C2)-methyltransferase
MQALLKQILKGEPAYRFKQAQKAVFKDFISDWSEATSLPLNLREKLNNECALATQGEIYESKDKKTAKAVIVLNDGFKIETVLMRHADGRNSLCVSSQVGCALNCEFCATGAGGFKRNLSADEIISQYLFFARYLKKDLPTGEARGKITNVIFMGMGEPFLNYESVLASVRILNDKDLIGLGARHISISTSGITEGIRKLAKENLQVNLAVSLHAPEDKLRLSLMPINKKYSLEKVLQAVDYYIEKTSRRVMFEYLMIKGVNDSPANAEKLANIMRRPLYLVNLISYNPTGKFEPSPEESITKFKNILEKNRVAVTRRYSFGQDIKAACGQLAGE